MMGAGLGAARYASTQSKLAAEEKERAVNANALVTGANHKVTEARATIDRLNADSRDLREQQVSLKKRVSDLNDLEAKALERANAADDLRRKAEARTAKARADIEGLENEVKERETKVSALGRASDAREALTVDPELAMKFALQSYDLNPNRQSIAALRSAVSAHVPSEGRSFGGMISYPFFFRPGGEVAAFNYAGRGIIHWDVTSGAQGYADLPPGCSANDVIAIAPRVLLACEPDFVWDVGGSAALKRFATSELIEMEVETPASPWPVRKRNRTVTDSTGRYFATPLRDGQILIWTEQGLAKTSKVGGALQELTFLKKSRRLLVRTVRSERQYFIFGKHDVEEMTLFDVRDDGSLKTVQTAELQGRALFRGRMIVHPFDRVVALTRNHKLQAWTLPYLDQLLVGARDVEQAAFSPDGSELAIGGRSGHVDLLSLTVRVPKSVASHSNGDIGTIIFSPRYPVLAAATRGDGSTSEVCDLDTGADLGRFKGMATQFAPDGKRVLALDSTLSGWRLWEPNVGSTVRLGGYTSVEQMSPNGEAVVVNRTEGLVLWQWGRNRSDVLLSKSESGASSPHVAFSFGGAYLVIVRSGHVDAWRTATVEHVPTPNGLGAGIDQAAISSGGEYLAVTRDRTVELWDIKRGRPVGNPRVFQGRVDQIEFAPGDSLLNVAMFSSVEIAQWSWANDVVRVVKLPGAPVLSHSPANVIITLQGDHVGLARIETTKEATSVATFRELPFGINVSWSQDAHFVVGIADSSLVICDGATGDVVWRMTARAESAGFVGATGDVVWTPSGSINGTLRIDRCEACLDSDHLVALARARLKNAESDFDAMMDAQRRLLGTRQNQ